MSHLARAATTATSLENLDRTADSLLNGDHVYSSSELNLSTAEKIKFEVTKKETKLKVEGSTGKVEIKSTSILVSTHEQIQYYVFVFDDFNVSEGVTFDIKLPDNVGIAILSQKTLSLDSDINYNGGLFFYSGGDMTLSSEISSDGASSHHEGYDAGDLTFQTAASLILGDGFALSADGGDAEHAEEHWWKKDKEDKREDNLSGGDAGNITIITGNGISLADGSPITSSDQIEVSAEEGIGSEHYQLVLDADGNPTGVDAIGAGNNTEDWHSQAGVITIPEPSSSTLLLGGSLMLLLRRKRLA